MAVRVTDADVKAILKTTVNTMPFIYAANILVTQHFATAGYDDAHMMELERWWAAHLVCMRDPRLTSKSLSDTKLDFEKAQMGKGLEATAYGQQVLSLDTLGILAPTVGPNAVGVKFAKVRVD